MKKRLLAILLLTSLCAGLLAGCGGKTGGGIGDEPLPEDDPSREVTISYWMYADDYKHYNSLNDNPVIKYLNKKFNVKFDFQTPAIGGEADNFNLMMGTQDYTDIINMTYTQESLNTFYEDGVILDLAPYLEEYMPNYYALINSSDEMRKEVYDDEGHVLSVSQFDDQTRTQWGGLVYRRDILETMTGGNVQFPSGNEDPTTVEDWDYMLPLMKQYFDASGMTDTACLIIPAVGYVATGELQAGWGVGPISGLGSDGKTYEYAPATDNFYNYLTKMHEWYAAGYIYPDFASRTNDQFFLPNTALTYGGAAGVWFGLLGQLSDRMSMPEYGLEMNVRPIAAPLDTAHGITEDQAGSRVTIPVVSERRCIASTVDKENLVRILTVLDYLYTEEGAMLCNNGLNAEQAAEDELYRELGFEDGTYWIDENGNLNQAEKFINALDYGIEPMSLTGQRIMGIAPEQTEPVNKERTYLDDAEDEADAIWKKYPATRVIPGGATMNAEESAKFNKAYTDILDYVDSMVPKFIIGTEPLNEESWKTYIQHLEDLGLQDIIDAQQSAYDRYMAR